MRAKKPNNSGRPSEPFLDEIEANYRTLKRQNGEDDPVLIVHGDEGDVIDIQTSQKDDDDMSIIQTEETTVLETQVEGNMQLEEKEEVETLEDILHLNSAEQQIDLAAENEIPLLVQQNIIKLSKEFGVHFRDCEEVALKVKIVSRNVRGLNEPRKRLQIKNMSNVVSFPSGKK